MPEISDSSVAEFRARLDGLGADPVLIGALAAQRYRAEPRHTVDVLLAETDYQRTAMARAVDGVLRVEDVLVHKLLAWRARWTEARRRWLRR